jgi:hypothetical protein
MQNITNSNKGFIDADPTMNQLENLIQMADTVIYADFLIGGWEADKPYYIDTRTHKTVKGIYSVKPIAENEKFFWYVCPYCQQIHIESKRLLTHDKPIRMTNCPYRFRINQYVEFDCAAEPIALQENVPDSVLQAEWEYMNTYLASRATK